MRLLFPSCLALLAAACGGDHCTFSSRCEGNVLETCFQQTITRPVVRSSTDCSTQNATCVGTPGGTASCVTNCDKTFVTHCETSQLVYCDFSSGQGLVTVIDCYDAFPSYCDPDFGCSCGGICLDNGGGNASCQPC